MTHYRFKTKPYKHQKAALLKLINNGFGGALLMEPRTGKTKVCIDYASILHEAGKVSRVLVVCPVSVIDVWVHEFNIHCPEEYQITIWDKDGRKNLPLPAWGRSHLDVVIMNYDAFSAPGAIMSRDGHGNIKRSKSRGGRFEVKKKLKKWQPQLIILDESHRIKSPSAKKATALVSLGPIADYRVLATGTAVTKKKRVFDLYMQWKFLNPESPLVKDQTSGTFKERFGQWTTRNGYPQWIRERNSKTLHRLVHQDSFAVTRDECYDLPAAFPPQIIHVELEESAKVYDEMVEEMIAKIGSGEVTEASIKLVQSLRLAQITSGFVKTSPTPAHPDGRLLRVGSEKLRIMDELFTDWFDQGEKVVVCARFRADIISIAKLAQKHKVKPEILMGGRGKNNRQERTAAIERFRVSEGPQVFIMNPQAGALGIDLRTASTMVWYSLTNSYVDYTQALDRIALSGKANRFVYLLGKGTYDELQYDSLQEDKEVVKAVMASPDMLRRNFR